MDKYYWFTILVAFNGLFLVLLAGNVSILRLKYRISYGDGDNKQLFTAIRAHANGIEQVPIFSLIILALTLTGTSQVYLASLVLIFTASRISHAAGLLFKIHILRRLGASITYILQISASILLLLKIMS